MEIIIIALTDTKVERVKHLMFPDAVSGMQTLGIIEQIAINRQKTCIDEMTKEAVVISGMRLTEKIIDGAERCEQVERGDNAPKSI